MEKAGRLGEDKRYQRKNRPQYRVADSLLANEDLTGKKVLELGAGVGEYAQYLAQKGAEVTCLDGTEHCVAETQNLGFESVCADFETDCLPFEDQSFDYITSLEIIEHLWNIDHYLGEIKRLLKPSGKAILTTPNYNYIKFRTLHLFGAFHKFTYQSRHKKFYTQKSFRWEIERHLKVDEIASFIALPKISLVAHRLSGLWSLHVGIKCRIS